MIMKKMLITALAAVSLMGSAKGGAPDADMWKGRAIGFVESLMKVLVAMRDAGYILLDANTIRNYFHLPKLESIVLDKLFPRDGLESISLERPIGFCLQGGRLRALISTDLKIVSFLSLCPSHASTIIRGIFL